jgi:predicted HicB family RNase H-like nuclease
MIRFLVNVPDDLHTNLRKIAKSRGQTLNGLIRQILWDWVKLNGAS